MLKTQLGWVHINTDADGKKMLNKDGSPGSETLMKKRVLPSIYFFLNYYVKC